jgi:hypothetical protein
MTNIVFFFFFFLLWSKLQTKSTLRFQAWLIHLSNEKSGAVLFCVLLLRETEGKEKNFTIGETNEFTDFK